MTSTILPTNSSDTIQTIVPRRYLKTIVYLLCVFGVVTTISFFSGVAWDDLEAVRNLSPFAQKQPEERPPTWSFSDSPTGSFDDPPTGFDDPSTVSLDDPPTGSLDDPPAESFDGSPTGSLDDFPNYPTDYAKWHIIEEALPQHNENLPFPEGKGGRYVYFSEHVKTAGWGNVLQEHFFQGLLAYLARRSYAFDSFSGTSDQPPFRNENGDVVPVNIPMGGFLSGPLAGGAFPSRDLTPRAVRKSYFDKVCPSPTLLDKAAIRAKLPENYTALHLLAVWVRAMDEEPARCVVIDERIFGIDVFGSPRIHDGLPVLFNNPIIKLFGWSPLIEDAFNFNKHLFSLSRNLPPPTPRHRYPPIPGLLALHVRRGDFEGHCQILRSFKARFSGLNIQPGTMDGDIKLFENEDGSLTQASVDAYQRACYPTTEQIVERVRAIRMTEEGKGLRNIFMMTNGSPEWIEELKEALMKDHAWEQISSSLEMRVTWEQKFTAQSVDMMIGQRADIFVGNGFSSLTGTVFMLRVASGLAAGRQRLWV